MALRYVASAPPEGGRHPALGFILFSRCRFCRILNRSGFKRMVAHGRAEGRDRANEFFGVVTSPTSFSQKDVATPKNSFSWPWKRLLRAFTF